MNPAKLTALYDAHFGAIEKRIAAERKEKPKQSLREYVRGG